MRFGKWKSGPAWVYVRGGFHLADFPQKVEQGCVHGPHAQNRTRCECMDAEVRNG
jgi:hypothetical protein